MLKDVIIKESHVEFVNYTGQYPNRCEGILVLRIDGETVCFGTKLALENARWTKKLEEKEENTLFGPFWESGGSCHARYGCERGEWVISVEELPEKYRNYALEIDKVFNENVPWGCCGGCI